MMRNPKTHQAYLIVWNKHPILLQKPRTATTASAIVSRMDKNKEIRRSIFSRKTEPNFFYGLASEESHTI